MAATPNPYLTIEEFRSSPDVSGVEIGAEYDTFIQDLIARASRFVDELFIVDPGAFKVSQDETRYFTRSKFTGERLLIGVLAAAPTSVSIAESGQVDSSAGTGGSYTALAATDYWLEPDNAPQQGQPYRWIVLDTQYGNYAEFPAYRRAIKIVGKFGISTSAPQLIRQAVLTQASRWFKRAQQGYADAGAIPELSQLRFVKVLDPDIAAIAEKSQYIQVTGF